MTIMSASPVLLVALLSVLVHAVLADVTCRKCTGCGDGGSSMAQTCTGKSCVKVTGAVAGALTTSRDCWPHEMQDSCSYGDAPGGSVTTCFCTVNMCNSAPAVVPAGRLHCGLLALAALAAARIVGSRW